MFLQFKDFHKQLPVLFVIYADFESLTTRPTFVPPYQTQASHQQRNSTIIKSVDSPMWLSPKGPITVNLLYSTVPWRRCSEQVSKKN